MVRIFILVSAVLLAATAADMAHAQVVASSWNTGNGNWNVAGNWSPADVPDNGGGFTYNVQIVNGAQVTFVPEDGTEDTVSSLALSNGSDLFTNGFQINVLGQTTIDGVGSTIRVDAHATPATPAFQTLDLDLNNGGALVMNGGIATVSAQLEINNAAVLQGYGQINLGDFDAVVEQAFENSGLIQVLGTATTPGTLTLHANGVDTIDLDGDSETGVVDVANVNADLELDTLTLVVDGPLDDELGGTLQIGQRDTVTFTKNFMMNSATVALDGGANTAALNGAGQITSIVGSNFTVSGSAVIDNDMTFNGTLNSIVMAANSTLTLNGDVDIPDASAIDLTAAGEALVIGGSTTIHEAGGDFDWDNAVTTVTTNGFLTINVEHINLGNDIYGGLLNLDGNGDLTVQDAGTEWTMAGMMTKNNAGTSSVNGDRVVVTGNVTVNAGTLDMPATTLSPGANVTVNGTLTLGNASILAGPTTINGAGTLSMEGTSAVTANTTVATSTFDWDGLGANTLQTINDGVVFTINSSTFDSDGDMDDPINLGGNAAQLIVNGSASWTMGRTLTANTAAAGTATIGGTSRLVLSGASALLSVHGNTNVTAPITFGASSTTSIDAGISLTAQGNAIYDGGTIGGAGNYDPGPTNTVTANSTINATNFNMDAGNWTIQNNALLTINVGDYDSDTASNGFDTTITLNSADISVNTADAAFIMNGTLNMSSTTPGEVTLWSGEPLQIGDDAGARDSKVNVSGTQFSRFGTQVTFKSDADVDVAAGATLDINGVVNFDTVNGANQAEFTGAGTLSFSQAVNVNEAVTLNMVGGVVDLDGSDATGDFINIDAPLTIKAATMASFGQVNGAGGANTLDIDALTPGHTGSLAVNLDNPSAEWTLNAAGVMNLMSTNAPLTLLQGSGVNLYGTVNVTGTAGTSARLDFAGTVNLQTAAPNGGLLLQAGAASDPNTLVGGTINGPGVLKATSGRILRGFGTINAPIDFAGTAELSADNGTLIINGSILDVGTLGTNDADGILNVVNAWNSGVADAVSINGGELKGGSVTIANSQGVFGRGLVSARVVNNSRIQATSGTFVIQTAANDNDWDGTGNTGVLAASGGGTLEVRDNASFAFGGTVSAATNSTVYANGFDLDFVAGSTISLTEGKFKSTNATSIRGTVLVSAGADSTIDIQTNHPLAFASTSATTLNGNLQLVSNDIDIAAGATFSGTGALVIPDGSHLIADANANINVRLDNRGAFRPAGFDGTGRIDMKDFQQSSTGKLFIELAGTGVNQFDRLVVSGAAQLNGTLDLDIDGAYVPVSGDTFTIISATGGVTGTFANVIPPPAGLPVGLYFKTVYSGTLVQLLVAHRGDYNLNGIVDTADYAIWRDNFGKVVAAFSGADGDGDGLIDTDDYAVWKAHFGQVAVNGSGAASGATVPEPASCVLALAALALPVFFGRRRGDPAN